MQKDTPIISSLQETDDVVGENQKLLLLHKEYLALTDDGEKEGSENADKD